MKSRNGRAWRWNKVKLADRVAFKVTGRDRLRALEVAEALQTTEAEAHRRAWLLGLSALEKERVA